MASTTTIPKNVSKLCNIYPHLFTGYQAGFRKSNPTRQPSFLRADHFFGPHFIVKFLWSEQV